MKTIILSEGEILCINKFMDEVTDIPVVECVYIVPFFSEEEQSEKIDIIVICNESLYYNGLLTGKEEMRFHESMKEKNYLNSLIERYNNDNIDGRLSFTKDYDDNYSLSLMHSREWYAEQAIASGAILFDRYGKKTENRKGALYYFGQQKNILLIENFQQIKLIGSKIPYISTLTNSILNRFIKPNNGVAKGTKEELAWSEGFCKVYCLGNGLPENYVRRQDSKLSIEEKTLFNDYYKAYSDGNLKVKSESIYETFMINVLGYDKINPVNKVVTTILSDPEQKYKSFIENGWEIEIVPSIVRDEDGHFYWNKENSKKRSLK